MKITPTIDLGSGVGKTNRGYAAIGLFHPKTSENVGSALRACKCYDASMLVIEGRRFKKSCTDTFQAWRHIPVLEVDKLKNSIPYGCVPVAIELVEGAISIETYNHPERAFYVFGPEDGSISKEVLSWCRDVVYIPTSGCMNLAATVNVVLYDRMTNPHRLKRCRDAERKEE